MQVDKPEWKSAAGVHFDMNPWSYYEDGRKELEALAALRYGPNHLNHFIVENNHARPTRVLHPI